MSPVSWDENTYNQMYSIRIRDPEHPLFGQRVGYSRLGMARAGDPYTDDLDIYENRWSRLTSLFPIQQTNRILIAGSGFGFLIEAAHDAGFLNVWGIDNSTYISARKGLEVRGDTLFIEDDLTGGGRVRNALRQLTGDDEFHWIISESVMESYTDTELPQLMNAAEAVLTTGLPLTNIIHLIVTATMDPPLVNRTLEQANALRPAHSWISLNDWTVL